MMSMSVRYTKLINSVLGYAKMFLDHIAVHAPKDTELETIQDPVKVKI